MEEHWFDKYEKIFVKNLFHSKMIWIQDFMETRLTEIYCKIHLSVFCQSVLLRFVGVLLLHSVDEIKSTMNLSKFWDCLTKDAFKVKVKVIRRSWNTKQLNNN